jgi:uncharacterized protein YdbL (DUF1318 family)
MRNNLAAEMLKGVVAVMVMCVSFSFAMPVQAGNIQQVKAAMKARIPELNHLKQKGIIGEDNRGFLAFRGSSREGADIVAAENRDRQTVYRAIAAKTGASPDDVGRRRAKKIAEIAPRGVWIQAPDGRWYRK